MNNLSAERVSAALAIAVEDVSGASRTLHLVTEFGNGMLVVPR